MESRNIYHVQDSDRPMYVLADSWHEALTKWQELVRRENDEDDKWEPQPQGISLVAETNDVLL